MTQFQYQCEHCGATESDLPHRCCDECIVIFFLKNPKALSIDQYAHWLEYDDEEDDE